MNWFKYHQREISFFIAGWCALACIEDLAKGNYALAAVNAALVVLNIKLAN
jgi:hypothetical protein